MEEDQEMKHFCKFCDKSFPCGRSLGGHMRSHLINTNSISHDNNSSSCKKIVKKKKKVSSVVSNGGGGYTLRENRKKTTKFTSSIDDYGGKEDDHNRKKICKECGKGFQSWKALFGHMKCHSDKVLNNNNNNNNCSSRIGDDSWNSSGSDDEESAPIRKQRSRTIKRYNNHNNNSSLSAACDDQILEEEEQDEEVAMSLILLSRHHVVGCWDSQKSSVSASAAAAVVVDSSENNNSEFLEARSWSQTTPTHKMMKKEQQHPKINVVKLELDSVSLDSETLLKMKQSSDDLFIESSKNLLIKNNNKRKGIDSFEDNDSDEVKKIKFECTSCNKTFHSYQALGGHRASHKKMKGCCFGSKIDSSENSTETADSKFVIKSHSSTIDDGIEILDSAENMKKKMKKKNNNKGNNNHECPICFKVFPSGQALGGHKRSHLIAAEAAAKNNNSSSNNNNSTQVMVIQKKVPEIRDFLDLNLPPEDDQEQETSDGVYFNPWWMMMGSNNCSHKNEQQLVGLL